jgi:hypothetical protein
MNSFKGAWFLSWGECALVFFSENGARNRTL